MEWSIHATRHVSRNIEQFKGQWGDWASQEEERRVKEWYSQTQINNALKLEVAELKEIIKVQGN